MELEFVLLGLISMHQNVTGYDINRIMRESTGYLISASLSHIYPSLRSLHEKGWVTYVDQPIKNRLAKKIYQITPAGELALQGWLKTPIVENDIDFSPFLLKMAFSPLMSKAVILEHVDREIARYELMFAEKDRGNYVEMGYLDNPKIDTTRAEFLWGEMYAVGIKTSHLRLDWLKSWRQKIANTLAE